jgi:hypothetical protein
MYRVLVDKPSAKGDIRSSLRHYTDYAKTDWKSGI